jgi:hypothetical protein
MKWVLQICIDANYEAFHAVREVTAIVWNIQKTNNTEDLPAPLVKSTLTRMIHGFVSGYMVLLLSIPVVSQLFTSIVLLMLLLLLAGIFSLSKNDMAVLLLVVPSICYNFGTMLLLCGPGVRFFHFNVVITLPLLLALSAKISNTLPQTANPALWVEVNSTSVCKTPRDAARTKHRPLRAKRPAPSLRGTRQGRHCEGRSPEAIQPQGCLTLDCFANARND